MSGRENVTATLACGLTGDIVRTFGGVRLRVFGTSMVPSILPGDLISIQRAGVPEISIGEVVLYSRDGRLFAHRVVGATAFSDDARLITRGDRLQYDDAPISSGELVGRVSCVERGGRKVDFAAFTSEWMSPLIRLLRASDFATNVYVRIVMFRPTRARHALPLQPSPAND
jgi:signal peptidase I